MLKYDCPKIRNLPKIFLRSFENMGQHSYIATCEELNAVAVAVQFSSTTTLEGRTLLFSDTPETSNKASLRSVAVSSGMTNNECNC